MTKAVCVLMEELLKKDGYEIEGDRDEAVVRRLAEMWKHKTSCPEKDLPEQIRRQLRQAFKSGKLKRYQHHGVMRGYRTLLASERAARRERSEQQRRRHHDEKMRSRRMRQTPNKWAVPA